MGSAAISRALPFVDAGAGDREVHANVGRAGIDPPGREEERDGRAQVTPAQGLGACVVEDRRVGAVAPLGPGGRRGGEQEEREKDPDHVESSFR